MRPLLCALALVCIGAPIAGCGATGAAPRVTVRSPLAAPRVTPGELDGAVLLGDTPLRATRMGAGPMSIVASGEVVEGERVGAFVDLPLDVCLLAYARGSSS